MKPIKYHCLDCETFASAVKGAVVVVLIEDLTGKVPHVGYGGASKSKYASPKSGREIFVLEVNGWYDADAYVNDVWQFEEDFSVDQAAEFVREWKERHADNL